MIRKTLSRLVSHPVTQGTRRITRRTVVTCAVILAVVLATSVTVNLGPSLKNLAERQGSNLLKRPIHIGRLGVWLGGGQFQLDDFVIEGLTPQSPPFLTVKSLRVGLSWFPLLNRRVVRSQKQPNVIYARIDKAFRLDLAACKFRNLRLSDHECRECIGRQR